MAIRSTLKKGNDRYKVCGLCKARSQGFKPTPRSSDSPRRKPREIEGLKEYFEYHSKRAKRSEQSGAPLQPNRSNLCHLLPKRKYRSVGGDIENIVYLTIDEHTRFDHLIDCNDFETLEREFSNCWYDVCLRASNVIKRTKENGKLKTLWTEYLIKNGLW